VNHRTHVPSVLEPLLFFVLAMALVAAASAWPVQSGAPTLKKVTAYDLPGPPGKRFDYLTIDNENNYLISAHLGANQTYVIDLATDKVLATIADTPGAEGVESVPERKKLYTANAGDSTIGVVDLTRMKVVKKLKTGAKPNGTAYAAPFHKIYVADTLARAVAVVDVEKDIIAETLEFESETGMPQYDSVARKVYVNLRNTNEVAEIDPASDAVLGTYPVAGCQFNHGMAVDSAHHRGFLLCTGNRTLTVFALDTHQALAHLPLPAGADVVKFDASLGRIYAACSSGFISVFQAEGSDRYRKLEDFPIEKMVHSLAVDPVTHRVYTPEQQEDGQPVARMVVYEATESTQKR
jgi:YVTN family beta-propeller protein